MDSKIYTLIPFNNKTHTNGPWVSLLFLWIINSYFRWASLNTHVANLISNLSITQMTFLEQPWLELDLIYILLSFMLQSTRTHVD